MVEKKKRVASEKQLQSLARARAARKINKALEVDSNQNVEPQVIREAPVIPEASKSVAETKEDTQSMNKRNWFSFPDRKAVPASKPPVDNKPQVKKIGGRRWWQIYVGIGLLIISAFIAKLYMDVPYNMIIAIFFVIFGASGFFTLYLGLKKRDEGYKFVKQGMEKVKVNANCLNIYYKKDGNENIKCDRIAFEEMISPEIYDEMEAVLPGQIRGDIISEMPQRCLDDGKFYYVHIFNPELNKLVPFELPDIQYFDPREMVNPVMMPAVKKELKPIPALGEKLKPVLLLVGIGILSVLFIATSGPPPGG